MYFRLKLLPLRKFIQVPIGANDCLFLPHTLIQFSSLRFNYRKFRTMLYLQAGYLRRQYKYELNRIEALENTIYSYLHPIHRKTNNFEKGWFENLSHCMIRWFCWTNFKVCNLVWDNSASPSSVVLDHATNDLFTTLKHATMYIVLSEQIKRTQ